MQMSLMDTFSDQSRRKIEQRRGVREREREDEGQVQWRVVLYPQALGPSWKIDFHVLKQGQKLFSCKLPNFPCGLFCVLEPRRLMLPWGCRPPGQRHGAISRWTLSFRGCGPTDISWVLCWAVGGYEGYNLNKIQPLPSGNSHVVGETDKLKTP